MTPQSLGRGTRGLVRALLPESTVAASGAGRIRQLIDGLPEPAVRDVWLVLAVLGRRLPTSPETQRAVRIARHGGTAALIVGIRRDRMRHPARWADPEVDVLEGVTMIDAYGAVSTRLTTGVQRLVRGIAGHWVERGAKMIGWSASGSQLRLIDTDAWRAGRRRGLVGRTGVVPWGGTYVLPELVTDGERNARVQALAEYSGSRSMLVGADVIPLSTAETAGARMPGVFANYLAAASRMDVVAAISEASAVEYLGWRDMLGAAGLVGPRIVTVPLATESGVVQTADQSAVEDSLLTRDEDGTLPLVLCVGSHEPRKNHGAVLQAAELLWREGRRFSLVFLGGNAWNSEEFALRLETLRAAGRPVRAISGASDDVVWWGYRLARLSVFPSLNEGFGLPIVESLAAGTPVVTSGFGAMAEVAADGGCLLIDPRDDHSVADGIRLLLEDDAEHARLAAAAGVRATRSWETYARELWDVAQGLK